MSQSQAQWASLLIPTITHHFDLGQKTVPQMREQLFGSAIPSRLSEENGTGIGSMGVEAWNEYQRSNKAGELDFDEGYTKTYTHVEYPVNFSVEKKLLINDQYGVMGSNFNRLGVSAAIKQELDAISILNNAFTDSAAFHGGDDKPLCSASHPSSPAKSATTQNNTGTSALTKTAVSTTRIKMMRFKDDKNDEVGIMPNELWVPPELQDTAIEIVGSQLDPDSGENARNPQNIAGRWVVKVALRLTGTKAWFMVDSTQRRMLVNWYEREAFQIMKTYEDTVFIRWQAKLHYSFGWDDWRWIYGHNPS